MITYMENKFTVVYFICLMQLVYYVEYKQSIYHQETPELYLVLPNSLCCEYLSIDTGTFYNKITAIRKIKKTA